MEAHTDAAADWEDLEIRLVAGTANQNEAIKKTGSPDTAPPPGAPSREETNRAAMGSIGPMVWPAARATRTPGERRALARAAIWAADEP